MKKIAMLLLTFIQCSSVLSQDAQYSQFFANPIYLNPAFTGTAEDFRAVAIHRIQWPNLPEAFSNSTVSLDWNASEINSGFGLMVNQETEGTAALRNTGVSFIYAYEANINNKVVIRPAIRFGHVFRDIDRSRLILGDQVDFGVPGAPSQDPQINSLRLKSHWDFGAGFLIYSRKYWFGFSADHLSRPNRSLLEGEDKLPMRYSVYLGSRFALQRLISVGSTIPSISPSILYRRQGRFQQLDVGASMHLQPMIFGLYYRGMPFLKNSFDRINQDAIILMTGVEYLNFEFVYSFDLNISKIDPVSGGGAHEFSLIYLFKMPRSPYKPPKNQRKLACPTFMKKLVN